MGLFSASTPQRVYAPRPDERPSIEKPIERPKEGSRLPPAPVLAPEHSLKVESIIDTLSDPDYALPTLSKDLKAFWKLRARANAASGTTTPASSPITPRTHLREGTDTSVTSLAAEQMSMAPLSEREKFWLTTEREPR
jgi:hypothetical protein